MKKTLIWLTVLAGLILPACLVAQETPKQEPSQESPKQSKPERRALGAYKLEFTLRELQDGKVVNTRTYMMVMDDNYHYSEVKIGSRVPVKTDPGINYLDVGTNIRCNRIQAEAPWVSLDCAVEVSSFTLPDQRLQAAPNAAPVLNQMRSSIPAVVQEGKQTVIGLIDDPNSVKRYEIAVTATKVK